MASFPRRVRFLTPLKFAKCRRAAWPPPFPVVSSSLAPSPRRSSVPRPRHAPAQSCPNPSRSRSAQPWIPARSCPRFRPSMATISPLTRRPRNRSHRSPPLPRPSLTDRPPLLPCPIHPVTETSQGPVTVACVAAFGGSDSAWPWGFLVSYRSSRTWPRTFGARPRRISRQRLFSDSREKSSSESVTKSTPCSCSPSPTYY